MAYNRDNEKVINERLEKYKNNKVNREMGLVTSSSANALSKIINGMEIVQIPIDELIPAPDEWNFFPKYNKDEMIELVQSICEVGILNPIIVWENPHDEDRNKKYMILAGHNRVNAYKLLYENANIEEKKKYISIPAYIKKGNEITEEEARQIIIDTNYVQRNNKHSIIIKAISEKYKLKGKNRKSTTKEYAIQIAEDYNISRRTVFNYYRLSNLIPELMTKLDNKEIILRNCIKLSFLDYKLQEELLNNYQYLLCDEIISRATTKILKEKKNTLELVDYLEQIKEKINEGDCLTSVTINLPKSLEDEFKKYIDIFLKKYNL